MCGVFAEFERAMIQERVKAGLARAVARGAKLGRPQIFAARNGRFTKRGLRDCLSGASQRVAASASGPYTTSCANGTRAKATIEPSVRIPFAPDSCLYSLAAAATSSLFAPV
jgi:Resolvase, N terminal domain